MKPLMLLLLIILTVSASASRVHSNLFKVYFSHDNSHAYSITGQGTGDTMQWTIHYIDIGTGDSHAVTGTYYEELKQVQCTDDGLILIHGYQCTIITKFVGAERVYSRTIESDS